MSARQSRPLAAEATAVLLLLIAACSSNPDTGNPDVGPPASVTVAGGDNQVAAPGAAVATAPSVVVHDAAGHAVTGVTVSFSVDSGGGSITTPNASTNSNGIASPGTWTLGASGPQVLGAQVGSLPKAKLRATLQGDAATTIATQTVTSGGGTITVNQSGSPLNGLSLKLLPGAVTASTSITLTSSPTTPFQLKPRMQAVTPALGIASSVTALNAPAVCGSPSARWAARSTSWRCAIPPPAPSASCRR